MNVRKNIDYTDMYAALDKAIAVQRSQMELYYEIGKAIIARPEKGAAVAAAEYIAEHYPGQKGFSPRNVRRMRDFCATYGLDEDILASAMQIGWTQNVVILEADLTVEEKYWYIRAAKEFCWSKPELMESISNSAHKHTVLEDCGSEGSSDNVRNDREILTVVSLIVCSLVSVLPFISRKPAFPIPMRY